MSDKEETWEWDDHELPFLPGYTFQDEIKTAFHRSQTLVYKNGFNVPRTPTIGIEPSPLLSAQLRLQEITLPIQHEPCFHACPTRQYEAFIPTYVALDKKVLRFNAYFTEDILYSREEHYRIRSVVMYYFLEDNTMCIMEPAVQNSGIPQGKRIKRQRLPKNELEYYNWTDLNVAMDLEVFGVKYHITDCDAFTEEFLSSEGIILNMPEPMPTDPYTTHRSKPKPFYHTPSEHKCVNQVQFLTMDRMVLRFFGLWDDSEALYGETRAVNIHYFLVDDTVEIREMHHANNGRYPYPILMRRQRLPKKTKTHIGSFPSCVLELSKHEVEEYYSPQDFHVGQKINMLGRQFLLCDCDNFTRDYYQSHFPNMVLKPVEPTIRQPQPTDQNKEVPPYNGFGTLEDSLQNCLSLIPKPPKKNVIKLLENHNKVLRYRAKMHTQNEIDDNRIFVLAYYLADDTISIYEKFARNSGIIGGKFLQKTRIHKPGSSTENPQFYSPADFAINSIVKVFSHYFVLIDADHYVLTYLESIQSQVPTETLESVRRYFEQRTEATKQHNEDTEAEPSSLNDLF